MGGTIILNFDESGNMGKSGRYFTIACIELFNNTKPLENIMKKAILKTKQQFPIFSRVREIKAKDSFPVIRDYFLRKIVSKDIKIRYIVADLNFVKRELLDDENLLYNYLLSLLIVPMAKTTSADKMIINLDKRTIKVKSTNSFADYIKLKVKYEMNRSFDIEVNYCESHNSYLIQAADFVANAIYAKYEHGYETYYNLFSHKVVHKALFPYANFGKGKVVSIR